MRHFPTTARAARRMGFPTTPGRALKDGTRYIERRRVVSTTSGRVYTLAYDTATGHHTCSCPAWRFNAARTCKHLRALGLAN